MLRYDVPFVSQYTDLGAHEWRARGCAVASLKMVMDYWHARDAANCTAPTLDALLREGLAIGAHPDDRGWAHRGLVALARAYGYDSYNVDVAPQSPTPETAEAAWHALLADLARGPVLVSVYAHFDPAAGGGHIVVVTGWDGELVAYSDPEELTEREGRKLLAREAFLRAFKRRWIAVFPESARVQAP